MNFFETLISSLSQPANYFYFRHPKYFYSEQEKFDSFLDLEDRVIDFAQYHQIDSQECDLFQVIDGREFLLRAKIKF